MRAKTVLYPLFYAAVFCAFALVFARVLFFDSYNPVVLLLCLLPAVGLIFLVHKLLTKHQPAIDRHYRAILIGFLSLYGLLVLVNGFLCVLLRRLIWTQSTAGQSNGSKKAHFPITMNTTGISPTT